MLVDGINLVEGSSVDNLTIASGSSFPGAANTAELFYRSDEGALYLYTGAEWVNLATPTLTESDITDALNYTPVNKNGDTMTGLLTLSADPSSALHAVTKQYADSIAAGLDPKGSVRAATTANISFSGPQTIDGVSVIDGDRVLVKNQSTGSQNGIYVAAAGSWFRATDFDGSPSSEVTAGAYTFVEEGTTQGDTGWVLTTNNPITIGSTALVFTQFTGSGGGVTSIAGAANQITASASTGAVTLSIPHPLTLGTASLGQTINFVAGNTTGTTTLIAGSAATTGAGGQLGIVAGAGNGASGGNLILASGSGSGSGTVTIRNGGVSGNIAINVNNNGTVTFPGTGSVSTTVTISGNSSSNPALNIQQGGLLIANSAGSAGQVLTSTGGNTPTWSYPGATTINAQTGTSYTFVLADSYQNGTVMVTANNASGQTFTIPLNTVAYPVGHTISIAQLGAGQVTIAPTGGVTLNGTGTKLRAQYSSATLIKLATNTWLLVGDITT